jgi:hypothetical protein
LIPNGSIPELQKAYWAFDDRCIKISPSIPKTDVINQGSYSVLQNGNRIINSFTNALLNKLPNGSGMKIVGVMKYLPALKTAESIRREPASLAVSLPIFNTMAMSI